MAAEASPEGPTNDRRRIVGLLYDDRMCKHEAPGGEPHYENPERIKAIWNKLRDSGITERCVVLKAKKAEDKNLLLVHGKDHVDLIKNVSSKAYNSRRKKLAESFDSVYLNKGSSESAYLAAGSVIEVAERVAAGDLSSGFAVVRPPGHHAEPDEAMGFFLCNNVAIAASYILNEKPELGINKILIVDWDVHHGNGTQKMFWKEDRVLFFSVHRHESGTFYPAKADGDYAMIGEEAGVGYNINVPWEKSGCGDADYLAVWDHILIPVAKEFNPDMVLISSGFDAAKGDPLGGCCVTPYGYSVMLQKLMNPADGKVVLALEGGYNLNSIATASLACMQALLGDAPPAGSSKPPRASGSTWNIIKQVRQTLQGAWPVLESDVDLVPDKATKFKCDALVELTESLKRVRQLEEEVERTTKMVEQVIKTAGKLFGEAGASPETVKSVIEELSNRFIEKKEKERGKARARGKGEGG